MASSHGDVERERSEKLETWEPSGPVDHLAIPVNAKMCVSSMVILHMGADIAGRLPDATSPETRCPPALDVETIILYYMIHHHRARNHA